MPEVRARPGGPRFPSGRPRPDDPPDLGDTLGATSRERLTAWLVANTTGDARLRAGLPGWRVGDKTGSDGEAISNDVAIAWPPGGGAPLIVACYYAESPADAAGRDRVIAEVGRIAAAWSGAG